MSERVDEWAMNFVHEFDGVALQNVSKGAVDLGDLQDAEEKKHLKKLRNNSSQWLINYRIHSRQKPKKCA